MSSLPLFAADVLITKMRAAGFLNTIIAGGFLRDFALGVPPKDIDVFIESSPYGSEYLGRRIAEALGIEPIEVTLQCELSYLGNNEADRIFAAGELDGLPVQIIELAPGINPAGRVPRFDFGLCQIWMDENGVHFTDAFDRDVAGRTLTLCYAESQEEHDRSMRRYERLTAPDRLGPRPLVDLTKRFPQFT